MAAKTKTTRPNEGEVLHRLGKAFEGGEGGKLVLYSVLL